MVVVSNAAYLSVGVAGLELGQHEDAAHLAAHTHRLVALHWPEAGALPAEGGERSSSAGPAGQHQGGVDPGHDDTVANIIVTPIIDADRLGLLHQLQIDLVIASGSFPEVNSTPIGSGILGKSLEENNPETSVIQPMFTVLNLSSEAMEELLLLLLTTKSTLSPKTDLSLQCEADSSPFLMSTL